MLRPALVAVLVLLALPAVAGAASVTRVGEEINYVTPGLDTVDNLGLSETGGFVVFGGPQVSAGMGCSDAGPNRASCSDQGDPRPSIELNLGDREETVTVTDPFVLKVVVNGGTGGDTLRMGSEFDVLFGQQDN